MTSALFDHMFQDSPSEVVKFSLDQMITAAFCKTSVPVSPFHWSRAHAVTGGVAQAVKQARSEAKAL